ncbi:MAG TPA: hypothetical protein VF706_02830 [Solirubrobacteraceae bacterium]
MGPCDGNLLTDVQRDALEAKTPLADALRKLVALGGIAGSAELRGWASLELRGYLGSEIEVPEYRKPSAGLQVDAIKGNFKITGQPIGPSWLPELAREHIREEVLLKHGVGEIEAMRRRAEAGGGFVKLVLPGVHDLVTLMNQESDEPSQYITAIYWSLSTPALAGVLDRVRTTLVELVAEIQAGMPESAATPSREVADQAVNVVINGRGARINVMAASASGSGSHEVRADGVLVRAGQSRVEAAWPALHEELAELGVPPEELDALRRALASDGDPPDGQLGQATSSWIGQLSTKVASGAIALGGAASTEVVSHAILRALGLA